uniref:flagellar hook-basal body complex protein n=1 Tax=Aliarcobacter sp. TaxID=2321116 RepID=UPI004047E8F8
MIGALWTGISGLSSQQQALDNESNNIANVNTVGFKASRISFADQMYQDRIGKGSKILDAEKLYVQGNLKLTGVNYDMALSGDGFFTVTNNRSSGTSETLYTRAGNFRMGDNGTLQDAAGNEVQGWMMTPIDSQNDVTSTNPNVTVFTNDYSKLLSSKVVKHGTYVETITAKATDYTATAKSDSSTVFSGAGAKTKSAKISDIEAAISDYANWLQKLKETPDGSSSTSIAQVSQINFKSGDDALVAKEGDQIYVYINGDKKSQNYIPTSASAALKAELYASSPSTYADPNDPLNPLTEAQEEQYNIAASRIATYKALADKISEISGLSATMVKESDTSISYNDVLQLDESFTPSTNVADMIKGMIQIKSLIPGKEFIVSEVAEVSGNTTVQGNFQTNTTALAGSGTGALESSRDALSRLITGKQQDVYTTSDLGLDGITPNTFTYGITIFDKDIGSSIPVPNDGAVPPQATNVTFSATTVDEFISQFKAFGDASSPKLTDYVEATNVNGNLVIKNLDKNYDVEFSGALKQLPSMKVNLNNVVDNSTYTFNIMGQTITIPTGDTATATDIRDSLVTQIALDPILSAKSLTVSALNNGAFSIYTMDDNNTFTNSNISIGSETIPASPILVPTGVTPPTFEANTVTITQLGGGGGLYSFTVLGETVSFDSSVAADDSLAAIYAGLSTAISSNSNLTGISIGALGGGGGNEFTLTQTALQNPSSPAGLNIVNGAQLANAIGTPFAVGSPAVHTFSPVLSAASSSSVFTLNIEGISLSVPTDQTPTISELKDALNVELAKNPALAAKITITNTATDIVVTNNQIDSTGYLGFSAASTLTAASLTASGDGVETATATVFATQPIDKNNNFSGRQGAGAEFIEIITKVDQTSSKGSLQLRLDTLGISDSAFGEFSVDSTGLITMKQDGADFAIGQVAIALFNNNRGLNPVGDNLLAKTNDSGEPIYNLNNNKTAKVEAQTLELSTADLSESLVNLMVFQRAFEANAKSITTSDELLNTLINLKR